MKQNVFKRPFRNCSDGCEAGTNVWTYDCYGGANQQWDSSSLVLQWNVVFAINISLLGWFTKCRSMLIYYLSMSSTSKQSDCSNWKLCSCWKFTTPSLGFSISCCVCTRRASLKELCLKSLCDVTTVSAGSIASSGITRITSIKTIKQFPPARPAKADHRPKEPVPQDSRQASHLLLLLRPSSLSINLQQKPLCGRQGARGSKSL